MVALLGAIVLLPLMWGAGTNFCWCKFRYLSDDEYAALGMQVALNNWSQIDPSVAQDLRAAMTPENCCKVFRRPFEGVHVDVRVWPFADRIRNKPDVLETFPLLFSACGDFKGIF